MIQRPQSLLLLASALLAFLLFYIPVYEIQSITADSTPVIIRSQMILQNVLLSIVNAAAGILAFFSIFLFRKRNLQMRLANLALLIACILIGLLFFSADISSSASNEKIHYLFGSYLPLLEVLLLFISIRLIRKDEELVRSADRLR